MVLNIIKYFVDKDKVTEFYKYLQEELIPYFLSLPGMKEMRAYRDDVSGMVLAEMEWKSYEAWGKAMDNPQTKKVGGKLSSFTHGINWELWSPSPVIPEPLKPKD